MLALLSALFSSPAVLSWAEFIAKWIAIGLGILLVVGGIYEAGHHNGYEDELAVFNAYKTSAAAEQLHLQQGFDAAGEVVSKQYADKLAADLAETKRQLQELKNAKPSSKTGDRHRNVGGPVSASGGGASPDIVGVLRRAAGGGK